MASLLHEEEEVEDLDSHQMILSLLPDLAVDLASSPASSDVHPPKAAAKGGDGCVICWEGQCTHVLAPCGHKVVPAPSLKKQVFCSSPHPCARTAKDFVMIPLDLIEEPLRFRSIAGIV